MLRNAWVTFVGALLALILHASAITVSAREASVIPEIAQSELPPEARETLQLVKKGGPFPHERDGIVFGNREKLLPLRERGYYREYTVPTPGARDRGARRIVAGGCADGASRPAPTKGEPREGARPGSAAQRFVAPCRGAEYYYTDDHYRSFKRIRE